MSSPLQRGDRVRVTAANRVSGYQPGDKGTVLWEAVSILRGTLYNAVEMTRTTPL
jgi:hypothetical protein